MQLDVPHIKILRDVSLFSTLERYRGMLPAKLAVYEEHLVEELLEAGYIERIEASFSCGSENLFYKITEIGEEILASLETGEPHPEVLEGAEVEDEALREPLTKKQNILLKDVHHFSKIHRYGGMMPHDKTKHYEVKDLNTLYAKGYIIKVKVDLGSGKKRKGIILSEKGVRYLQVI